MVNILWFKGGFTSQVVQNFFHQQYGSTVSCVTPCTYEICPMAFSQIHKYTLFDPVTPLERSPWVVVHRVSKKKCTNMVHPYKFHLRIWFVVEKRHNCEHGFVNHESISELFNEIHSNMYNSRRSDIYIYRSHTINQVVFHSLNSPGGELITAEFKFGDWTRSTIMTHVISRVSLSRALL